MKPIRKLTSTVLLGLCWLMAPGAALAYSWDLTLSPSEATTLFVHPGDAVDVFAWLSAPADAPLDILGDVCLAFPSLCSGNEGITVSLDVADPAIFFDLTSAAAPPATVPAGGQQSFLIGTLRILPGAPTNRDFHILVDVTPDPRIDATLTVVDTPTPVTLSLSLPVHISPVPEPASWLLMAVGLAGVWRRRVTRPAQG